MKENTTTQWETRYAASPREVKGMNTQQLRDEFLIPTLFEHDTIRWVYTHYDRYMAGGVMPRNRSVDLEAIDPLKAEHFLDRREIGIINVGGSGTVTIDGEVFSLDYKEALYVGKGKVSVSFSSDDATKPAKFYLNSAPAHASLPTKKVGHAEANVLELGDSSTANRRTVRQMLIGGIVDTCQLQMGMTELHEGNVWNTMPAHVHDRRMEIYFYFEVPEDQAVCHFMGPIDETRHVFMHNEQAIISPPWSIHSGSGTSNYCFIWGMAGENMDYGDMDTAAIKELR